MSNYNVKLTVRAPSNFDSEVIIEDIENLLQDDIDLNYSTCNEFICSNETEDYNYYFIDFEVYAPSNFDKDGVMWAVKDSLEEGEYFLSGDFSLEEEIIVTELV